MIIDPDDPEIALDDDGTMMGAVKMLPWDGKSQAPSAADFRDAAIVGYIRPDALHLGSCDCDGKHE